MAKPRRGLGRGLNSLLNTPGDEQRTAVDNIEESSRQPERYTVNAHSNSYDSPAHRENKPELANHVESKSESQAQPVVQSTEKENIVKEEPLYSDKEDNLTIKSVVECEVSKPVEIAAERAPQKKTEAPTISAKDNDEVDIDLIEPNPDQPRTNFKREELEELADSIKKDGLLQPLLVREIEENRYQIIAGERRWQACKALGMKTVPVRIKAADDNRAIELALVENIQRSDLNPIEEAYGYRRMMERGNLTQSEVAKTLSKGRSTIANALRLLELPEDAQQLIFEEKITAGHARAILSIPTEAGRKALTEKLVKERLSVRETEAIARLLSGKKSEAKTTRVPLPQSYKKVARALRESLNTNVRVKSSKGKNKIEIEFSDEEDLERLFKAIMAEQQSSDIEAIETQE